VHRSGCSRTASPKPRFELGDLVREHADQLRAQHPVTPEQGKVLRALAACRTPALGGHLDRCLDCGLERNAYNSCRNRHCPKCQALDAARWLAGRMQTLLPVPYFHVVCTLPGELAPVVMRNRTVLFDLLFRAASQTLLTLGRDPHRLGAQLGFTMVLHTWTRDLRFHPHVHAVVTGGGLSDDGQRWVPADPRYLFPVAVLSSLFRGKMLALLRQQHERQPLDLPTELETDGAFDHLISSLYGKTWITYAKPPFAGPPQVLAYLARYTHRVAISNHRILDVDDDAVTIRTRGEQTVTLTPVELLRRFLVHLLPARFVRIRHYGLLAAGNLASRLETARELLSPASPLETPAAGITTIDHAAGTDLLHGDWRALLSHLTGIDPDRCPACGSERWIRAPLPTQRLSRAPPEKAVA